MNHQDHTGIVPPQYTGKEIETAAECILSSEEEAIAFYKKARERLLNVNEWHDIAGVISAKFSLVAPGGQEVNRFAQEGDFFKVDIPGPGSSEGDGYDWVQVEAAREINEPNLQSTALRVRPCANPFGNPEETAHFYGEEGTSVFVVTREGSTVRAAVVDRNIKPNDNAHSLKDKVRDMAIGAWAMGVFSKIQWQQLAKGLVKKDN